MWVYAASLRGAFCWELLLLFTNRQWECCVCVHDCLAMVQYLACIFFQGFKKCTRDHLWAGYLRSLVYGGWGMSYYLPEICRMHP